MALKPGDHICALYASSRDLVDTVSHFIIEGLRRGERCWYIPTSDRHAGALRTALENRHVNVDRRAKRGALRIVRSSDAYAIRGDFDPERTVGIFSDAIEAALRDGFTSFRAAADMSWALELPGGANRLIAYEALLKTLFASSRATGLCLFHRRRTPRRVLDAAIATHPFARVAGRYQRNPFYDAAVNSLRVTRPRDLDAKVRLLAPARPGTRKGPHPSR